MNQNTEAQPRRSNGGYHGQKHREERKRNARGAHCNQCRRRRQRNRKRCSHRRHASEPRKRLHEPRDHVAQKRFRASRRFGGNACCGRHSLRRAGREPNRYGQRQRRTRADGICKRQPQRPRPRWCRRARRRQSLGQRRRTRRARRRTWWWRRRCQHPNVRLHGQLCSNACRRWPRNHGKRAEHRGNREALQRSPRRKRRHACHRQLVASEIGRCR